MVREFVNWMNNADPDFGVFAVGELSEEDKAWLPDVLPDFDLSLVSWSERELIVQRGTEAATLVFDGECWKEKNPATNGTAKEDAPTDH